MKFQSEPVEEHHEVPLADEGQWEELVSHWQTRESGPKARPEEGNQCYVVSVCPPDQRYDEGRLQEILGLVDAQDDHIVGHEVVRLQAVEPRTYLGKGRAMDIAERAREAGADLLVVDMTLTPSQMRNLEDLTGFPLSDREAVILNVFQKHARTKAARMQVEMAHLAYLRPRIRGIGLNMDQQAGGIMGSRGPGETASELLARKLDGRIAQLRKGLARLSQESKNQRKHREHCQKIVLAGYTNAGKTSLMNALTAATGTIRNRPFETLDTTTRSLTRHGGDVLLSDTVGFIRDLPERLFASFASTLEEVTDASLIVVALDASDPNRALHLETTIEILKELGADALPRLIVCNKKDRCTPQQIEEVEAWLDEQEQGFFVSAHNEDDITCLKEQLIQAVRGEEGRATWFIPYHRAEAMCDMYATCRVLDTQPDEHGMHVSVEGTPADLARIQRVLEGGER